MRRHLPVLLLVTTPIATAVAQSPPPLVLVGVRVVESRRSVPVPATVTIANGVITAIDESGRTPARPPVGAQVIDLRGRYLIPGLWDMHVHTAVYPVGGQPELSENAEYKAAKERQTFVQARISLLHQRLSEVDSIDLTKIPEGRVAYGSVVELFDLDKEEKVTYELVTSEESDPDNGKISTVSPIGQAVMGKEEGDEVKVKTPNGWKKFEISRLTTIHEK